MANRVCPNCGHPIGLTARARTILMRYPQLTVTELGDRLNREGWFKRYHATSIAPTVHTIYKRVRNK